MHLSNSLNRQSTLEGHISLVRTPFWSIQLLMESSVSLLSYVIDFSSIGFVVCEIYPKYRRCVWTMTLILVPTFKTHISLILKPLDFNYISKWLIGCLVSNATGFVSIWFLVCEILSKHRRSPVLNARQCGAEVLRIVVYSSMALTYSSIEPLFHQVALCLMYTRVYNPILEYSPSELQFCFLASPYSSIATNTGVYHFWKFKNILQKLKLYTPMLKLVKINHQKHN